jgi:hypothetical protein
LVRNQNNVSEWSDISTRWLLLAHLAKGNVSFYHHLAPVVRHLFTFHILIVSSEMPQPSEVKLSRKLLWKVLCNDYSFRPDLLTNMVATGDSCFWLADFFKSSPLNLLGQMNRNLVGSNYGRSSIEIAHFIPIPQTEHKYDLSRISWNDSSTAVTLIGFFCKVNLIYNRY